MTSPKFLKKVTAALGTIAALVSGTVPTSHAVLIENALYEEKVQPLSLDQAILMALENNLDIELAAINPLIEEQRILGAQGTFDPIFQFQALREYNEKPQNTQELLSNSGIVNEYSENNLRLSTSLQGLLPTGTQYELSARSDELRNSLNRIRGNFAPEYEANYTFTVTQPLLRNFGIDINLAEVNLARNAREVAIYNLQSRAMATMADVINTYTQLVFAMQNIQVKREAIGLGEKLRDDNQRRVDQGVMAPIDVIQAETQISQAEEELILAENMFVERQNELKSMIYSNFLLNSNVRLEPTTGLDERVPAMDLISMMNTLIQRNPDYLAALEMLEAENIRLKYAKNQAWPQVDLIGSIGANGLGPSYNDSFDDTTTRDDPNWAVGVQVQVPLFNRRARAQRQEAQLRRRYAIVNIKNTETKLASALDTAADRVRANARRVQSARKSLELAQESLNLEQKRLEQGVTTSFNVLELQSGLSDARTRVLAATVDLNNAITNMRLVAGTLPSHHGVVFGDPKEKPGVSINYSLSRPAPDNLRDEVTPYNVPERTPPSLNTVPQNPADMFPSVR